MRSTITKSMNHIVVGLEQFTEKLISI